VDFLAGYFAAKHKHSKPDFPAVEFAVAQAALAFKTGGKLSLRSRNGNDFALVSIDSEGVGVSSERHCRQPRSRLRNQHQAGSDTDRAVGRDIMRRVANPETSGHYTKTSQSHEKACTSSVRIVSIAERS
jgi:hypothetical protein